MPDGTLHAIPVSAGDLDTITRTLFGECRGESLKGQQGVAWVIRRRAIYRWGGAISPEAVCIAHDQFSCWRQDDVNRNKLLSLPADSLEYKALYEVARSVMAGEVNDPTGGATNYEVVGTSAPWTVGRAPTWTEGKHEFYDLAH